jgi:1-deoxy-D-xylulose-5-phosphate reductoisomerase
MTLKRTGVSFNKNSSGHDKKNIVILGSTGSIGCSCLEIIRANPDNYKVIGLSASTNIKALAKQVLEFKPLVASIADPKLYKPLKELLSAALSQRYFQKLSVTAGPECLEALACHEQADIYVLAIVGAAGVLPAMAAASTGKTMALANKEALVSAGSFVMKSAAEHKTVIIPVDSEHSALFQCLESIGFMPDQSGPDITKKVKRLILTASGGPFRDYTPDMMKSITKKQALKHPNWSMGGKITIDSASLMNKGLEIIEAFHLFKIPCKKIEALIHPQSVIHSAVEFIDGSMLSQMGVPDMKIPIQYALTWPNRVVTGDSALFLDLIKTEKLTFSRIRKELFPCFTLALEALEKGGALPAVMNAANEIAVGSFLDDNISFLQIPHVISRVMDKFENCAASDVFQVMELDSQARKAAKEVIYGFRKN